MFGGLSMTHLVSTTELLKNYDVGSEIGSGASATVYSVTERTSKKPYVMKVISTLGLTDGEQSNVQAEVEALKRANHPNIIMHHESNINDQNCVIIMEKCETTLETVIDSARIHMEEALKKAKKAKRAAAAAAKDGKSAHLTISSSASSSTSSSASTDGVSSPIAATSLPSPFPEELLIEWMAELLSALQYLHKHRIVHRDIKTGNIFVSRKNHLKLGDFGVCTILASAPAAEGGDDADGAALIGDDGLNDSTHRKSAPSSPRAKSPRVGDGVKRRGGPSSSAAATSAAAAAGSASPRGGRGESAASSSSYAAAHHSNNGGGGGAGAATYSFVGTPFYIAPEVCSGEPWTPQSDVWSLGIVLYELCTLQRPFDGLNIMRLVEAITEGPIPPFPAGHLKDSRFEMIVLSMLNRDPLKRPTVKTLLEKYFVLPASHPSHPLMVPSKARDVQYHHGPKLGFPIIEPQIYTGGDTSAFGNGGNGPTRCDSHSSSLVSITGRHPSVSPHGGQSQSFMESASHHHPQRGWLTPRTTVTSAGGGTAAVAGGAAKSSTTAATATAPAKRQSNAVPSGTKLGTGGGRVPPPVESTTATTSVSGTTINGKRRAPSSARPKSSSGIGIGISGGSGATSRGGPPPPATTNAAAVRSASAANRARSPLLSQSRSQASGSASSVSAIPSSSAQQQHSITAVSGVGGQRPRGLSGTGGKLVVSPHHNANNNVTSPLTPPAALAASVRGGGGGGGGSSSSFSSIPQAPIRVPAEKEKGEREKGTTTTTFGNNHNNNTNGTPNAPQQHSEAFKQRIKNVKSTVNISALRRQMMAKHKEELAQQRQQSDVLYFSNNGEDEEALRATAREVRQQQQQQQQNYSNPQQNINNSEDPYAVDEGSYRNRRPPLSRGQSPVAARRIVAGGHVDPFTSPPSLASDGSGVADQQHQQPHYYGHHGHSHSPPGLDRHNSNAHSYRTDGGGSFSGGAAEGGSAAPFSRRPSTAPANASGGHHSDAGDHSASSNASYDPHSRYHHHSQQQQQQQPAGRLGGRVPSNVSSAASASVSRRRADSLLSQSQRGLAGGAGGDIIATPMGVFGITPDGPAPLSGHGSPIRDGSGVQHGTAVVNTSSSSSPLQQQQQQQQPLAFQMRRISPTPAARASTPVGIASAAAANNERTASPPSPNQQRRRQPSASAGPPPRVRTPSTVTKAVHVDPLRSPPQAPRSPSSASSPNGHSQQHDLQQPQQQHYLSNNHHNAQRSQPDVPPKTSSSSGNNARRVDALRVRDSESDSDDEGEGEAAQLEGTVNNNNGDRTSHPSSPSPTASSPPHKQGTEEERSGMSSPRRDEFGACSDTTTDSDSQCQGRGGGEGGKATTEAKGETARRRWGTSAAANAVNKHADPMQAVGVLSASNLAAASDNASSDAHLKSPSAASTPHADNSQRRQRRGGGGEGDTSPSSAMPLGHILAALEASADTLSINDLDDIALALNRIRVRRFGMY